MRGNKNRERLNPRTGREEGASKVGELRGKGARGKDVKKEGERQGHEERRRNT